MKKVRHSEDLTNKKFGLLTAIKRVKNIKDKYVAWLCLCECGKEKIVRSADLKRGRTRSCGCLLKAKNNPNVRKRIEKIKKPFGEATFNSLYFDYKYNAKARNLEFNLTKTQFKKLATGNCAYCGIEPKQVYYKKCANGNFIYNGIDRINNNIGYVIDNCVPACKFCNYAKKCGTQEEFLEWINRLITLGR